MKTLTKLDAIEWAIIITIALLVISAVAFIWAGVNYGHKVDAWMASGQCERFQMGTQRKIECILRRMERQQREQR